MIIKYNEIKYVLMLGLLLNTQDHNREQVYI